VTDHAALRQALIDTARRMNDSGLNQGTSGNISQRVEGGFLITPSGMDYDRLVPDDIVFMDLGGLATGDRFPSSEWRFHRDILAARPEIAVVLHTHSVHATALACLRLEIPAFHYMVAIAGGISIRLAPYATFGTAELSRHAVAALEGRLACLLANHGLIALGGSLAHAFKLATEVETLAAMYGKALAIGALILLSEAEMAEVIEKFKTYGSQRAVPQSPFSMEG
jgi:L-fuculose-phosphate aldolase